MEVVQSLIPQAESNIDIFMFSPTLILTRFDLFWLSWCALKFMTHGKVLVLTFTPDNRLALYFDTEQCLLSFVVQSEDEYECNSCEDICPSQDFTLMHFQRYKMLCLFILLLKKNVFK